MIINRAVRTFGYGLTGVLLGLYLTFLGGSAATTVAALGISLATGAALNIVVAYQGERLGRRRSMLLFGILMAASGFALAIAPNLWVALGALLLGTTSPTGTEVSPFLSVEQSIVAEAAPSGQRTKAFALYNLVGALAGAGGALTSGVPTLLQGVAPTTADPLRPLFALSGLAGAAAAILSHLLPEAVDSGAGGPRVPLSPQSRSRVARISSLFSVDSFAGGFVLQSFVSLWFYTTYPESRAVLPVIFFAAGVLSAFSFLVAANLGRRYGLLETMVFTHIPSNVLLMMVPLVPLFPVSLAFYLGRMALSQMDVPTRQSYISGIVAREERTAANSLTNTSRNVAQSAGPFSSGALVALLGLSVPFLIGGALKIAYDLSLFRSFRVVRPDEV